MSAIHCGSLAKSPAVDDEMPLSWTLPVISRATKKAIAGSGKNR